MIVSREKMKPYYYYFAFLSFFITGSVIGLDTSKYLSALHRFR